MTSLRSKPFAAAPCALIRTISERSRSVSSRRSLSSVSTTSSRWRLGYVTYIYGCIYIDIGHIIYTHTYIYIYTYTYIYIYYVCDNYGCDMSLTTGSCTHFIFVFVRKLTIQASFWGCHPATDPFQSQVKQMGGNGRVTKCTKQSRLDCIAI